MPVNSEHKSYKNVALQPFPKNKMKKNSLDSRVNFI